jgi:hypothetical protein
VNSSELEPNTIDIMNKTPTVALTVDIDANIFDSLQPEDKEKEFGEVQNNWQKYQERVTTDFCAEKNETSKS